MNTVFDHPFWAEIRSYARLSIKRDNLDLLALPDNLRSQALAFTAPCVSCSDVIHIFRARKKSGRSRIAGQVEEHRLFYAATCPASKNPGCSRSHQAKGHKRRLKDLLGAQREVKKMVVIKMFDASQMLLSLTQSDLREIVALSLPKEASMMTISYVEV